MLGTHENIIHAFFKLLKKKAFYSITMSDIAKEACISRQAIYQKHFASIHDILVEIQNTIYQDVYSCLQDYDTSLNSFDDFNIFIADNILPNLYKYHMWLKILYNSDINYNWYQFIENQYLPILETYTSSNNLKLSKEFLNEYCIRCYLSITITWLSEELPLPPHSFKKYFLKLVEPLSSLINP